jgi:hypothetical protein
VVRFSYRMVPEVYQVFWAGMAAGEFINDAAVAGQVGAVRSPGDRVYVRRAPHSGLSHTTLLETSPNPAGESKGCD